MSRELLPSPKSKPIYAAQQIQEEFRARCIEEILAEVRRLDTKVSDGDVVWARRTALLDTIRLLGKVGTKPYHHYPTPEEPSND